MVNGMSNTSCNSRVEYLGKATNGRQEYLIEGQKYSVAEKDKYKFEATVDKYYKASDKYLNFKANHSFGAAMIGLGNLLLIGGTTIAGVKGSMALLKKNASKTLRGFGAVLGGMIGFILSGYLTNYTTIPGRKELKETKKQLATIDLYECSNAK